MQADPNHQVKLSQVMKAIVEQLLLKPTRRPSSEAAHAALLVSHVGWNRTLGHRLEGYQRVLATLEIERPSLWSELKSRDAQQLIALAQDAKQRQWADDRRVILVCGMIEGKVHVEWCHERDFAAAQAQVAQALRHPPPWARRIDS